MPSPIYFIDTLSFPSTEELPGLGQVEQGSDEDPE